MSIPTEHALRWRMEAEAATAREERLIKNQSRAERRRSLYESDPIWRLTKLKDNRERRLRAKLKREGRYPF